MPHHKKTTILAIDPGTRYMGIAVLDGDALLYHGVKTIPEKHSPHERLKIARCAVLRMMHDFQPDTLAIEKAFFANNRNSALLNVLVDEIRAVAQQRRIAVVAMAPSTVKKRITGNGHATKRAVAEAIISRYPELKVYRGQDRQWKERYHGNMFDAIAIGLTSDKHRWIGSPAVASAARLP